VIPLAKPAPGVEAREQEIQVHLGELESLVQDYQKIGGQMLYDFLVSALPTIIRRKKPAAEVFKGLERCVYNMMLLAYLLGWVHVTELARGEAIFAEIVPEPLPMEEAITLFKARVPLEPQEFYALQAPLRLRAFTVARLVGLDAINRVKEAISRVLEEGQTLSQFLEEVGAQAVIQRAGFDTTSPWYWETVFRTNVMSAYSSGRWAAIQKHKGAFPYLEILTIPDERRCPICGPLHGMVKPVEDPFWQSHHPPLHFNCRCVVRPIHKREAQDMNIEPSPVRTQDLPPVMEGFGGVPSLAALPPSMLERAREYGILDEVMGLAERLGLSWMADPLEAVVRAKEDTIVHLDHEKCFVFDSSGKTVFQKEGKESSIFLTKEEAEKLRNRVFTHNHPGGASFSWADIDTLWKTGLKEIRAVTKEFLYRMKILEPGEGLQKAEKMWWDLFRKAREERGKEIQRLIDDGFAPDEAGRMAWARMTHEIWLQITAQVPCLKYERLRR